MSRNGYLKGKICGAPSCTEARLEISDSQGSLLQPLSLSKAQGVSCWPFMTALAPGHYKVCFTCLTGSCHVCMELDIAAGQTVTLAFDLGCGGDKRKPAVRRPAKKRTRAKPK